MLLKKISVLGSMIHFGLSFQWGSFDVLENFALTPDAAYQESVTTSKCSCRAECINNYNCYTFGIELKSPYRYACRFFNNTANMTIMSSTDGLVGGPYIKGASLKSDGFYYFVAPQTSNFTAIVPSCNVTLGNVQFKLALIKTNASLNALSQVSQLSAIPYLTVDLVKNAKPNDTTATFGDGTPYEEAEFALAVPLANDEGYPSYYTYGNEHFYDVSAVGGYFLYPVCQGNPLKLKV